MWFPENPVVVLLWEVLFETRQHLRHFLHSWQSKAGIIQHHPIRYHLIIPKMKVSPKFTCWLLIIGVISQSETKHQFLHVRKRKCHDLTVVTVPAAAHSTSVQLCTAVTFHYSASCCPQYNRAAVYSSHVSLQCQLLPTVQPCSCVQQSRFITVPAAAHSTTVQLCTAVTFRCGPAGSIEGAAIRRTDECASS